MTDNQSRIARYSVRGALLGATAGALLVAWGLLTGGVGGPSGGTIADVAIVLFATQLGFPISLLLSPLVSASLPGPGIVGITAWAIYAWVVAAPALGWAFWGAVIALLQARFTRDAERLVRMHRDRTG